MTAEKQRIRSQLAEGDSVFDTWAQLYHSESSALLLLVQRKVLQAFFERHTDGPSEMEWDRYLGMFQEALGFVEEYMKLTEDGAREYTTRPVLVVAMDLVLPLFLISTKCRHSAIRRRALRMLKSCSRREGIWDSYLCSRMAERMIELEERSSEGGFIPESARICELDVRLAEHEDNVVEVRQKKLVLDETGSRRVVTVEEAMVW